MYVPIILGTAREGRRSEKVADFMLSRAKGHGIESEVLDVRDYHIKATDNTGEIPPAKRLAEKVARADALIIVSPEYNHSFPGELKMMLDMLFDEYAGKMVGICGVSNGPFGGARGMEQLKLVLVNFRMRIMSTVLYFSSVQEIFDEKGEPKDKEAWERRTEKFFDELKG